MDQPSSFDSFGSARAAIAAASDPPATTAGPRLPQGMLCYEAVGLVFAKAIGDSWLFIDRKGQLETVRPCDIPDVILALELVGRSISIDAFRARLAPDAPVPKTLDWVSRNIFGAYVQTAA